MSGLLKVLTMLVLNKFGSTPAGSRLMGLANSAKSADSLWQKFAPQTTGV